MMSADELEMLIKAVAGSDRRTVGKADVMMWGMAAQQGRWTLSMAMQALARWRLDHPGEWLEPGHLHQVIKLARSKAAATFAPPPEPDDLPPVQYPEWLRKQLDAHIQQVMTGWAAGETIPDAPPPGAIAARDDVLALTAGAPPEIGTSVREFVRVFGKDRTPNRSRRRSAVPRRGPVDRSRLATARAELTSISQHRTPENRLEEEGSPA